VDVSTNNEEIHDGVDFPGSLLNMEDREVGIENGEQDDKEEGEEEVMAIEIDIKVGFPVVLPPNRSTPPEEHVSAEWFGWPLASIP
jgi:hypothetical protein